MPTLLPPPPPLNGSSTLFAIYDLFQGPVTGAKEGGGGLGKGLQRPSPPRASQFSPTLATGPRVLNPVLNGSCMLLYVGGLQGCSQDKHPIDWRCARAVRKRPLRMASMSPCVSALGRLGPQCVRGAKTLLQAFLCLGIDQRAQEGALWRR